VSASVTTSVPKYSIDFDWYWITEKTKNTFMLSTYKATTIELIGYDSRARDLNDREFV